jgi:hypothetical protein
VAVGVEDLRPVAVVPVVIAAEVVEVAELVLRAMVCVEKSLLLLLRVSTHPLPQPHRQPLKQPLRNLWRALEKLTNLLRVPRRRRRPPNLRKRGGPACSLNRLLLHRKRRLLLPLQLQPYLPNPRLSLSLQPLPLRFLHRPFLKSLRKKYTYRPPFHPYLKLRHLFLSKPQEMI